MKTNSVFSIIYLFFISFALSISLFPGFAHFLVAFVCFSFLLICCWYLYHRPLSFQANPCKSPFSPRVFSLKNAAVYFAIVLCFSVIYWLAYYPGGFNLDAYGQWLQAHLKMPFNDWHPITSTLILKFILAIHDSFDFYILSQILFFSVSIAFLLETLEELGISHKILVLMAIYIGLCPSIGLNTITLTKDVQFTILIINLTTFYIKIVASDGFWIRKPINILLIGIITALAALVRHNGLLFVVPAYIILFLCYWKQIRYTLLAVLISVSLIFIIKVPVSDWLNVEKHDNFTGEIVGIPMAVMGNTLINAPEEMPEDIYNFLNEIAPYDEWKTHYISGEWDSCKWIFGGTELLKDESFLKIISYAWKAAKQFPQYAFTSVRENIRIFADLFHTFDYWAPEVYIESNPFGISSSAILPFQKVIEFLKSVSFLPFVSVFIWNTGF